MRIIISLVIICLSLTDVTGQNNELEDIIRTSLNSYVKENREGINRATMKDKFYFSIDNYPPHFKFEDTIQGIPVKYVNTNYPLASKISLKSTVGIAVLRIKLENSKMIISITDYSVKFEKKISRWILNESMIFIYEYSCEQQKWLLLKTERNGY